MTVLLKLYPPSWRRRYGEELGALIDAQPVSIGNTIDVISGAIDAWIHPQLIAIIQPATTAKGEKPMSAENLRFRCAGYQPHITRTDQRKSAATMLIATVVLSLGWMWLHVRTHGAPYVDAFSLMPFLAGWLLSMRYTYLKERSGPAQAIFMAGSIGILTLLFGLAGWITSRI
jgi:hypothetical protein